MCVSRLVLVLVAARSGMGGDFSDRPNRYEIDLAAPYHAYAMTAADHRWADSLLHNLHQNIHITYLTRTDIPLWRDGVLVDSAVYHPVGKLNDWYYVADGDTIIITSEHAIISPGSGGFPYMRRNRVTSLWR